MAELKQLIETHWETLSPTYQRIGGYILSNPFLVATMGVEDLAKATGVSAPTITRFVRSLGLSGFSDFRNIAIRGYQRLLQPVDNVGRANHRSAQAVIQDSLQSTQDNIKTLSADFPLAACEALAERLVTCESVGFLGFGSSAWALTHFANMTEPFVKNQVLLTGTGGHERTAGQIGKMGARDVIIAMATPRYSAATPEFVRLARGLGVPCIGITDSAESPIYELCDESILLPAGHSVLNTSNVAAIIFFETITALMTGRYQDVSQAAALTRLIFPYLYADGDTPSDPSPKES